MCSIFKYKNCVGRNFDYEVSYHEELRIVNRNQFNNKYKIIGMVTGAVKDYPLFYDGMNECGLVMGGLAFQGNAQYNDIDMSKTNVQSYRFILKVLGNYESVSEVKELLKDLNITNQAFSDTMPPSDLHWFIADEEESIIVEQTSDGLNWYDGEVMTNNPPYPKQLEWSEMELSDVGDNIFSIGLGDYSRGLETLGLDGDYTSNGRFNRLIYLKEKLEQSKNDFNPVSQAFHLLSSVEQIYGATPVDDKYEYTIYSVVYDMMDKIVYLKPYDEIGYKINQLEWYND